MSSGWWRRVLSFVLPACAVTAFYEWYDPDAMNAGTAAAMIPGLTGAWCAA